MVDCKMVCLYVFDMKFLKYSIICINWLFFEEDNFESCVKNCLDKGREK